MDLALKQRFLDIWNTSFPGAELPITLYYTDEEGRAPSVEPKETQHCLIGELLNIRNGRPACFDKHNVLCRGGRRYLGFSQTIRNNFDYFLSCGIPGELEGERYKKSPEIVADSMQNMPPFESPGRYLIAKRWDLLEESDEPMLVVFFARADVLAGLFTLANFDEREPDGVIAPFGSGCSAILYHPYRELQSDRPRAVLGMFDVSARPFVQPDVLSFAVPWKKFLAMVANADESFLITGSWAEVRSRIGGRAEAGLSH